MFAIRRYTKFLFALPVISLVLAAATYTAASLRDSGNRKVAVQTQTMVAEALPSRPAISSKPYSQQSYQEKRDTEKRLGIHPEITFFKASDKVYRGVDPANSHCRNPGFLVANESRNFNDMQETIWQLRDASVRLHAFFVSKDGQVPSLYEHLKRLDIPGGYGVITQTTTGMSFTPDRAEAAQYWLAEVAKVSIKPEPSGMFIIVAEPLPGGC